MVIIEWLVTECSSFLCLWPSLIISVVLAKDLPRTFLSALKPIMSVCPSDGFFDEGCQGFKRNLAPAAGRHILVAWYWPHGVARLLGRSAGSAGETTAPLPLTRYRKARGAHFTFAVFFLSFCVGYVLVDRSRGRIDGWAS